MKYPLNVIVWLIPFILVLGYFSFSSGSTLYFLVTVLFFFGVIILIYPFYSKGEEILALNRRKTDMKSEVEQLENWWSEAMDGRAVSQRLVEDKIYSILIEEISDRFGIKREDIPRFLESGNLDMDKNVLNVVKKIFERRHNLRISVGKDEFENDINTIIDFLGGKDGY